MKVILRTLCGCQQVVDVSRDDTRYGYRIAICKRFPAVLVNSPELLSEPTHEERIFEYIGNYSELYDVIYHTHEDDFLACCMFHVHVISSQMQNATCKRMHRQRQHANGM